MIFMCGKSMSASSACLITSRYGCDLEYLVNAISTISRAKSRPTNKKRKIPSITQINQESYKIKIADQIGHYLLMDLPDISKEVDINNCRLCDSLHDLPPSKAKVKISPLVIPGTDHVTQQNEKTSQNLDVN
ncbi:hypothetical protein OUZ56_026435 [Daphnia magna]|uniref:Uncharacterized protein n=1 Tax=Daphnia magna TaxID=35525 RepID=A0ABQ9ZM54_9CRUS|nr:hypothetical protein OUZ56_026435 [Daphnia magna]